MSKAIIVQLGVGVAFFVAFANLAESRGKRAGVRSRSVSSLKEHLASSAPELKWSKRMKGAISGLTLSRDGNRVAVSTFSDSDIPGSAKHALISLLSTDGQLLWEQRAKYPIKDLAISPDGQLIVLSTYLDQLVGIDARGRQIWMASGLCKPYVLKDPNRIVCYHDDDAGPDSAFDVFDWSGNKVGSFPIEKDVIAFKFSEDQKNFALALDGGEVVLFDLAFKPLWRSKLPSGEVVDLAVVSSSPGRTSSSPSPRPSALIGTPRVVALTRVGQKSEQLVFFDDQGKILGQVAPTFAADQVEVSQDGQMAYYYGSTPSGQWVGGASFEALKEIWKQGEPSVSRYGASINLASNLVWTGVEHFSDTSSQRESRIFVYNDSGKKVYELALPSDETSYIYSHRISIVPNWFVVGTDDAKLSVYRF